jgi:DNA-binding CsgD family transcriptional regulator
VTGARQRTPKHARLTLTEARIARLLAEGRSNQEVADLLATRVKAVQEQLARVYRKLGVESRTELALLLTTASVAEPPDEASTSPI